MSQHEVMLPDPDPFKILLLSVFSLAARLEPYPPGPPGPLVTGSSASFPFEGDGYQGGLNQTQTQTQAYPPQQSSEEYFAQAKALIGTLNLIHSFLLSRFPNSNSPSIRSIQEDKLAITN
jgi:hypothetical protein